eukprot:66847-Chlamydomonas_euryale.AAC.1
MKSIKGVALKSRLVIKVWDRKVRSASVWGGGNGSAGAGATAAGPQARANEHAASLLHKTNSREASRRLASLLTVTSWSILLQPWSSPSPPLPFPPLHNGPCPFPPSPMRPTPPVLGATASSPVQLAPPFRLATGL